MVGQEKNQAARMCDMWPSTQWRPCGELTQGIGVTVRAGATHGSSESGHRGRVSLMRWLWARSLVCASLAVAWAVGLDRVWIEP